MHRFFLNQEDRIFNDTIDIFNSDLLHQFKSVLRFRNGEKIILIDKNQNEFISEITEISGKFYKLQILETKKNEEEPKIYIHLYFSILKKLEKIEFILQKCTEIGVSEFTPIITERTEAKSLGKIQRLQRILKESAEQSGRSKIPKLNEIAYFKNLITKNSNISEGKLNIIPHPGTQTMLTNISNEIDNTKKINIFIGPEGGFSENELNTIKTLINFKSINLGPRILRTETAAIIVPAVILQNYS
jgi:16S rRNA (uracil1498-N3)-methyltransferase